MRFVAQVLRVLVCLATNLIPGESVDVVVKVNISLAGNVAYVILVISVFHNGAHFNMKDNFWNIHLMI